MKLMIDHHEEHYGCLHNRVSGVIGGDWNEKPFPDIP
jgi:hypothetical protein